MTDARCATSARRRGDSLVGTAAPARRWLLVEHPGGWAPAALRSAGIPPQLTARLDRAARDTGGRVLLVRRPVRRPAERGSGSRTTPARRWAVVDGSGSQEWGSWRTPEDLSDAVERFHDQPTKPAVRDPRGDDVLLLVCTHGRHDVCCAVRGRPVALALAARWPKQTWECTHVGGDRFAANLLVLPDGAVYGNLDALSAPDVVARHLTGVVDTDHLRGFSADPPPVQVALSAALRHLGPNAATPLVPGAVHRVREDRWLVEVHHAQDPSTQLTVRVDRSRAAPARLTCQARTDTSATTWTGTVVTTTVR